MQTHTKEQLKNLKQIYDEQTFKKRCDDAVKTVYEGVIDAACDGKCEYTTSAINFQLKENGIKIVVDQLRNLFPDAKVMYIDRMFSILNVPSTDLIKSGVISINWM
jgi:hypothetical protein